MIQTGALTLLLSLILACAQAEGRTLEFGHATQFKLSQPELRRLEAAASNGDAAAGLKVALHFGMYHPTLSPEDDKISLHWMQIAAENGSPLAMKYFAAALRNMGGSENCRRALFWITKALPHLPRVESEDGRYLFEEIQAAPDCRKAFP